VLSDQTSSEDYVQKICESLTPSLGHISSKNTKIHDQLTHYIFVHFVSKATVDLEKCLIGYQEKRQRGQCASWVSTVQEL